MCSLTHVTGRWIAECVLWQCDRDHRRDICFGEGALHGEPSFGAQGFVSKLLNVSVDDVFSALEKGLCTVSRLLPGSPE